MEVSAIRERTEGDEARERWSEYIGDAVFEAGSLAALMVSVRTGNAARADPAEREAEPRCYRTAFCLLHTEWLTVPPVVAT